LCTLATTAEAKDDPFWSETHVQIGLSGGRLGTQITSMTEELRGFFGAPTDAGVLISKVEADSPAAKAGLKVGDVLVEVDGKTIDAPSELVRGLHDKGKGAKVSLTVVREKKRQTLSATLRDGGKTGLGPDMRYFFDSKGAPHGMRMFAFDDETIDKLQKQIEELTRRLQKLEQKGK
jgi:C-terminal processing protease CtpA/Prc